jgi:hypothetical protein
MSSTGCALLTLPFSDCSPRDLSRPGGPWNYDRDSRPDFDRSERDRPHPWDNDRHRDADRPNPWDMRKSVDSRRPTVMSSVTRPGDRDHDGHESSRGLKRGGADDEKDDESKNTKRRKFEEDGGKSKDRAEHEKIESESLRKVQDDYEADDGADMHYRDDGRSGRRVPQVSSVVTRNSDDSRRERRREVRPERQEKPNVPISENTEIKQRNRKMFGALLGHLQKAKKEEEKILLTPTMQKRAEIEEKVEVLARESGELLRRKLAEEMREERRKNLEQIRLVRTRYTLQLMVMFCSARALTAVFRQQAALHLLAVARIETQRKSLSGFIRTVATPEIFWRPVRPDEAKVQPLLTRTQEQLQATADATRERVEAERAADIEAEAAAQAQRQAARESGLHVEEEEEEQHESQHGGLSGPPEPSPAAPQREQAVEEVDEEEGAVDVEIAF